METQEPVHIVVEDEEDEEGDSHQLNMEDIIHRSDELTLDTLPSLNPQLTVVRCANYTVSPPPALGTEEYEKLLGEVEDQMVDVSCVFVLCLPCSFPTLHRMLCSLYALFCLG